MGFKNIPRLKTIFSESAEDREVDFHEGARKIPGIITGTKATYDLNDDFNAETIDANQWTTTTVSASASITISNGILTIGTGTDGIATAKIQSILDWRLDNTAINKIIWEARIKANLNSNSNGQYIIGFGATGPDDVNDNVILIHFTTATNINSQRLRTEKNNTTTNSGEFQVTNGTFNLVRIELTTNEAKIFIDNKLLKTITTNIPDDLGLKVGCWISNVGSGTNNTIDIDYMRIRIE